jgi:hypothetical protein
MDDVSAKSIEKFRELIEKFKRPFLESLGTESNNLKNVLIQFETLYMILYTYIESATFDTSNSINQNIIKTFIQSGGLDAYKKHPSMKELLLHYLEMDLKTYPYTIRPKKDTIDISQ